MKRKFGFASVAALSLLNVFGGYTVNTTHPPFYFQDEKEARTRLIDDWVDIYNNNSAKPITQNGSVTFRATIKSDHKTVKGWGLSESKDIGKCFNWDYNNSTNYTVSYNSNYEGKTHYLYVHLRWFQYSLSLISEGQSVEGWPQDEICYTNSVALPALVKDGYTHEGWTNDVVSVPLAGNISGGDLGIAEDGKEVLLAAKWTANSYEVTFDPNGGAVDPSVRSFVYDSPYGEMPEPERKGYSFLGWYTEKDSGVQVTSDTRFTATQSHTLYAHWKANQYTVTFYNYGATSAGDGSKTVVYDGNPGPLSMIPSWGDGYSFGGYFTGENGSGVQYWDLNGFFVRDAWDIAADTELHAYKVASEFTVYYDANGASGEIVQSTGLYGGAVKLSDGSGFSKPDFRFMGWARDSHAVEGEFNAGEEVSVQVLADGASYKQVTLYAVWKDLRREINFDYMGGIAGVTSRTNLIGGVYGELPEAAWEGGKYEFLGWFTERSGGDEILADTVIPDGDGPVTLYAHWDAAGFFVEFKGNGEDEDSAAMAMQEFAFDTPQALSSNVFSKTGYTFAGWATNENAAAALEATFTDGQTVSNLADSAAATVELHAVWSTNEYSVVFNAGGGEGAMKPQRFFWNQPQALTSNLFTRASTWRFDGWSNVVNNAVYADGETVSNLTSVAGAEVELTAVWTDLLTKWSRAADCTNLVLECEADKAWSVDDTFGAVGGTSVHANFISSEKRFSMTAKLPTSGTITFLVKAISASGSSVVTFLEKGNYNNRFVTIEGATDGWVQCVCDVDAELEVEWRAMFDCEDEKAWIDNIRWYPLKSVSVKDGTQAEISGEDANAIKSEVLAHWHEIFANESETYSSAVFSVAKDDVGRAAAALKLGFCPVVIPDAVGNALLMCPWYPEIYISAFSATNPAVTLVGVDVSCGNAMPVWADSAARSLRLLGAPQLTSEWTRVDAALDTAKYLSSGEAVFSFDALTNRFFKVIAE